MPADGASTIDDKPKKFTGKRRAGDNSVSAKKRSVQLESAASTKLDREVDLENRSPSNVHNVAGACALPKDTADTKDNTDEPSAKTTYEYVRRSIEKLRSAAVPLKRTTKRPSSKSLATSMQPLADAPKAVLGLPVDPVWLHIIPKLDRIDRLSLAASCNEFRNVFRYDRRLFADMRCLGITREGHIRDIVRMAEHAKMRDAASGMEPGEDMPYFTHFDASLVCCLFSIMLFDNVRLSLGTTFLTHLKLGGVAKTATPTSWNISNDRGFLVNAVSDDDLNTVKWSCFTALVWTCPALVSLDIDVVVTSTSMVDGDDVLAQEGAGLAPPPLRHLGLRLDIRTGRTDFTHQIIRMFPGLHSLELDVDTDNSDVDVMTACDGYLPLARTLQAFDGVAKTLERLLVVTRDAKDNGQVMQHTAKLFPDIQHFMLLPTSWVQERVENLADNLGAMTRLKSLALPRAKLCRDDLDAIPQTLQQLDLSDNPELLAADIEHLLKRVAPTLETLNIRGTNLVSLSEGIRAWPEMPCLVSLTVDTVDIAGSLSELVEKAPNMRYNMSVCPHTDFFILTLLTRLL